MSFKYRNRQINLNKLNQSKVREIVSNVIRERDEHIKKHLTELQTNKIIEDLVNNCQTDINNKMYETTLNFYIEQYEQICRSNSIYFLPSTSKSI